MPRTPRTPRPSRLVEALSVEAVYLAGIACRPLARRPLDGDSSVGVSSTQYTSL